MHAAGVTKLCTVPYRPVRIQQTQVRCVRVFLLYAILCFGTLRLTQWRQYAIDGFRKGKPLKIKNRYQLTQMSPRTLE